jgi:16S rRNA processing protein RimM
VSGPALPADWVVLGEIVGVYGVRGWVKIKSHTRPREAIFEYGSWHVGTRDGWRLHELVSGRPQGPGLVAQLGDISDRDQARSLIGAQIAIPREQLPPAGPGEFYWADLEGCKVINRDGDDLGVVSHMLETGANDVMVVSNGEERLIPYVGDFIDEVDLEAKVIRVDWDKDF